MVASSAHAAVPNLITNGDFEATSGLITGDFMTFLNGSSGITGWDIGATSVDLIKNSYNAINVTSVDMLGTPGPGQISQSFGALAGTVYTLGFDLGRNPFSHGADVTVNFGDQTGSFSGNNLVAHYTMSFTAQTSAVSLLSFASVGGDGYSGAVLDNVSVTSVPEPETYALLLAGLGFIGFTTRRKAAAKTAA